MYIIAFALGFLACTGKINDEIYPYTLKSISTIDFKIGFSTWDVDLEYIDSVEKISFADLRTNKKIILMPLSANSKEMITIPIDTVVNLGVQLAGYEIINQDTLLLFDDYGKRIYHLDFKGNLVKIFDLNNVMPRRPFFDLYISRMGIGFKNKRDLLFHCSYNSYNDTTGNNYRNNLEELIDMQRKQPYFFRVTDLFKENVQVDFGLDNFYARFTNKDHLFFESSHYITNDSLIYLFSNYSDTLYEINSENLKINKLHKISSDYTQIGYTPATLTDRQSNPEFVNELGRTKGFIQQLQIDHFRNLIYMIVLHEIPIETDVSETIKPWSIIIYNLNFDKLGEVKMDETKYGSFMISSKEGLLISDAPTRQYDEDFYEKTTFELFELVKN